MKVVCDTNILISALVFPGGPPDHILNLARLSEITLCLSPEILTEFRKVLRVKFKYEEAEVEEIVERIVAISEIVYPSVRISVIKQDEADNRILECAVAAGAEFLVSGDKKDVLPLKTFGKTRIVSASRFLELWKAS